LFNSKLNYRKLGFNIPFNVALQQIFFYNPFVNTVL